MVQLSLDVKVLVLHHTAEDVSKVDIDTATNTLPGQFAAGVFSALAWPSPSSAC